MHCIFLLTEKKKKLLAGTAWEGTAIKDNGKSNEPNYKGMKIQLSPRHELWLEHARWKVSGYNTMG